MGSFFVVRQNNQVTCVPPTSILNQYEDGENNTVLFKVACVAGKYLIYHKDSLYDESFCDTSHMVHFPIKTFQ